MAARNRRPKSIASELFRISREVFVRWFVDMLTLYDHKNNYNFLYSIHCADLAHTRTQHEAAACDGPAPPSLVLTFRTLHYMQGEAFPWHPLLLSWSYQNRRAVRR